MYSVAVVFARLLFKTCVAKSDELALTEGKTAVQLLRDWHSSFSLIVKFASFSSKILTTPFSKFGLAISEAFGARYFMSMSNSGTRFTTSSKRSPVDDKSIDSRCRAKNTESRTFKFSWTSNLFWFSRALSNESSIVGSLEKCCSSTCFNSNYYRLNTPSLTCFCQTLSEDNSSNPGARKPTWKFQLEAVRIQVKSAPAV